MSGIPGLLISLLLPALLGYTWLHFLWKDSHLAVQIGYGYLLGISFLTSAIYAWSALDLSLCFMPIALTLLLVTLIPIAISSIFPRQSNPKLDGTNNIGSWQIWLWWLLFGLLVIRFGGLLLEELWRPLYPWDAWMNWAPRAKVWFSIKELAPFVDHAQWPKESLETGAYTLGNSGASLYPPLVPLVQLWTAMGLGEWRDNWINLPWMMCAMAFFLAFYGQLRMLKIKPIASMLAVYLLFSIPYLNTHVALAGYAELWLAAFYCSAVMALIGWSLTGSRMQLALVLLMGAACIMTKRPGLAWATTLAPGLLLVIFPTWLRYLSLVIGAGVIGYLFVTGGIDLNLSSSLKLIISRDLVQIPGLGQYELTYHPAGAYFISNDLVRNNWHLLGWMLAMLAPVVLYRVSHKPELLPGFIVMVSGLLFVILVFFFTLHFSAAENSTTINRASFHLLPALLYFFVITLTLSEGRCMSRRPVPHSPGSSVDKHHCPNPVH